MSATREGIRIGELTIRFLLEGAATGGALAMFEFDVAPGAKLPAAHSHDGYEEIVYGLDGVLTWTISGRTHELRPGDVLVIPRGAVHRFDNYDTATAKTLAVVTPGILGPQYFREVAELVGAAAGGPPDPAAIGAVMRKHGLTPALQ